MNARNQERPSLQGESGKKIYINPSDIRLGEKEILWQAKKDQWIPIRGLESDENGIYLTGSRVISWVYYICSNCGWSYKYKPSECENPDCSCTDFYQEYEDIWDRA